MTCVIFDLDGTLVDSAADVCEAFKIAFKHFEIEHLPITRGLIGPPAKSIIEKLSIYPLQETLKTQILCKFREIHDNSRLELALAMPNARKILTDLQSINCGIAIATNKPRSGTRNILEKFFKDIQFDCIACLGDESINSKYDSIKSVITGRKYERYIMVGDTQSDISSAKLNGITAVAYTKGYGNEKDLAELHPDYMIDDLLEIGKIIKTESQCGI